MYAERRRRVLRAMGEGAVAFFPGARLVTRSADTTFPFRQDSDFHYLTGFDHPHALAVLRTDGGPEFTLFVEPRDPDAETWTGYRPGVDGARADHGADEAHPNTELLERVPGLIERARRLYLALGRERELEACITRTLDRMRLCSRQGLLPAAEIVDPRAIVHEMRLLKEPAEIDCMRRAAAITLEAHREAARLARAGRNEYEVAAVLDYSFRRLGAAGPAYESIVAGGRNATVLHYVTNDQPLRDGELLLIDAGCELEGYASDVTRTYPIGGRFEGAARDLYQAVLAAQEASLAAAGPGATLAAVHDAAVHALTAGLVDLGLLAGDVDELVKNEAYKPWYMHSTSHWLGLDVHDVGAYTADGKPRRLEPGMVFTVEPGLYVSADDERAPEAFRGLGVRIEDDVAVTEDGTENLTAAIPKSPADVEAWVRG